MLWTKHDLNRQDAQWLVLQLSNLGREPAAAPWTLHAILAESRAAEVDILLENADYAPQLARLCLRYVWYETAGYTRVCVMLKTGRRLVWIYLLCPV